MTRVSILNLTGRNAPLRQLTSAFKDVVKELLPGWEISLVFVDKKQARALNTRLRKKTYVPNVLSYTVGNKSAEIIICPEVAKSEAALYAHSPTAHILYLFIHGALHIKGWSHGGRMEKCERDLLARFAKGSSDAIFNETTHRNRHRHRHVPGKAGRRRGSH